MRIEDGFQLVRGRLHIAYPSHYLTAAFTPKTHFTERNAYLSDSVLPSLLKRILPPKYDFHRYRITVRPLFMIVQDSKRDRTRPRTIGIGCHHQ